jgi:hypothetical protein
MAGLFRHLHYTFEVLNTGEADQEMPRYKPLRTHAPDHLRTKVQPVTRRAWDAIHLRNVDAIVRAAFGCKSARALVSMSGANGVLCPGEHSRRRIENGEFLGFNEHQIGIMQIQSREFESLDACSAGEDVVADDG